MVLEFSLKGKSIREEETITSFSESVLVFSWAKPKKELKASATKANLFFIIWVIGFIFNGAKFVTFRTNTIVQF